MAEILQIRVSAYTFNPLEVEQRWPSLYRIASGENYFQKKPLGVLELVITLNDKIQFSDTISKDIKDFLREPVQKAFALKKQLDAALSNWEAKLADKIAYELEDALDEAEQSIGDRL
ncbi:MAG: hypothetical protein Q9M37_05380 [Desulfonauticus sp.]|nr:hypothetical protein [Desulfonauticus sp.]